MEEEQLKSATSAAKFLGITVGAFYLRQYIPAKIIDGRKYYDINNLHWERKLRTDKGIKRGARKAN